jgi:hypothetical protein
MKSKLGHCCFQSRPRVETVQYPAAQQRRAAAVCRRPETRISHQRRHRAALSARKMKEAAKAALPKPHLSGYGPLGGSHMKFWIFVAAFAAYGGRLRCEFWGSTAWRGRVCRTATSRYRLLWVR